MREGDDMIPVERLDALDRAIEHGQVLRHEWALLGHISPEAAAAKDPFACPAETLDAWFAQLLLFIDDRCSLERRYEFLRRVAVVLRQWDSLPSEVRSRLDYECRAIAVREARQHIPASEEPSLAALDVVLALLDRASTSGEISEQEWLAAGRAAWWPWLAASFAKEWAAVGATTWAARATGRAAAAARASEEAAASADRMIDAMLTAMERECAKVAAGR